MIELLVDRYAERTVELIKLGKDYECTPEWIRFGHHGRPRRGQGAENVLGNVNGARDGRQLDRQRIGR